MAATRIWTGQEFGDRGILQGQLAAQNGHERRSRRRYPLDLSIRCRSLKRGELGAGKVVDMSSGAVSFTTVEGCLLGEMVEVSIDWPVPLFDGSAIKLKVKGSVVRSGADRAAISIMWHEFYVRRTHGLEASS